MINKFLTRLKQTESLSGVSISTEAKLIPYKRFGSVWVRADKPIKEIYLKTIKNSELQFYPNTNYKAWGMWLLKLLKLKNNNYSLQKLLGIAVNWQFIKPVYLPLQADIIYYRHNAIIMIYTGIDKKKVIKVVITNWGETLMKSEIESQGLAGSFQ